MRCNNCGKFIPDVSRVCNYCGNTVDPTKRYVEPTPVESIENKKFDLKSFVKNPSNSKIVIGALALILFLIILIIVFILSIISNKTPGYKIFTNTLNELSEYLEDNYLSSNGSGTFTITSTIDSEENIITGDYEYDVKNKIFSLNVNLETGEQENSEDIIIDGTKASLSGYLSSDNLYLYSKSVFDSYIYFQIPDDEGLFSTKKYDIETLIMSNFDALEYALKQESYSTTSKKIDYFDKNIKVSCVTLTLDNDTKYSMIKNIMEELIDDSNYLTEMARIKDKSTEDIETELQNYITTAEYKYSKDSSLKDTISIYYKNTKIYRIEFILSDNTSYILDVDESVGKYNYQHLKDNTIDDEISIISSSKELTDEVESEYDVTYNLNERNGNLLINLVKDNKPTVKKQTIENSKDIKTFTDEEYELLRNNLNKYINDTSIIDKIKETYKEKCTPDLNCVCGDTTCSCTYEKTTITCDIEKVKNN